MDPLLTAYFDQPLSADQWRMTAVAALRSLLADTPVRPESIWASRHLFSGYPDGQWFEIHRPGQVSYMQVGKNGRYSRNPPPGVSETQLVKVTPPPPPHLGIRRFLDRLAGKFAGGQEAEFARLLRELSPALQAMGRGSFDTNEVGAFLRGCGERLRAGQSAVPFCEQYASGLLQRHRSFRAPGYLVAYMLVLDRSWRLMPAQPVVDFMLASLDAPGAPLHEKVRSVNDLLALVLKALVGEAGEAAAVERAIQSMKEAGQQLVQDAQDAGSVGEFYGKLYESCPWLYGAFRGYQFLAGISSHPDQRRRHRASAGFCEELSVRTRNSLDQNFGQCVGTGSLDASRKQIAKLRREEGDFAAEMQADQQINSELLFPPFWKPYLLGQTDLIPARRGP